MTMRMAIVSTYPPRPCGIGTFSRDLRSALLEVDPSLEIDVVAIVRDHHASTEPEVLSVIRQDVRADYVAVPALLDGRGTDVVLIEHEYGIFGGEAGSYVLSLVQELRQPFVVTLHTVLSAPSAAAGRGARRALPPRRPGHRVHRDRTPDGRRRRRRAGRPGAGRPARRAHGAAAAASPTPRDAATADRTTARSGPMAHLEGRTVLSTFGLISAGKGIETAIEALAEIVPLHPEVLYLVAGQTHPEVVKEEGERYRLSLERLVRDRGLERNVQFLDRFLSMEELAFLLSSTDLYLTPYRSREQIVSGRADVRRRRRLPGGLDAVLLRRGPARLRRRDPGAVRRSDGLRQGRPAAARQPGRPRRPRRRRLGGSAPGWPGRPSARRPSTFCGRPGSSAPRRRARPSPAGWRRRPSIRSDHLLTLVDDVGIVQHADGVVPNLSSGYCVDDMARLVIVAARAGSRARRPHLQPDGHAGPRASCGTPGIPAAPGMHNLMSYDRRWLDEPHGGDHVGRAVWALGAVIAAHPPRAVAAPSLRLLTRTGPGGRPGWTACGPWAFAVIGLARPPLDALPDELRGLLA